MSGNIDYTLLPKETHLAITKKKKKTPHIQSYKYTFRDLLRTPVFQMGFKEKLHFKEMLILKIRRACALKTIRGKNHKSFSVKSSQNRE